MSRTVKMPVPHGAAAAAVWREGGRTVVFSVDEGAEQELADALIEAAKEMTR
ncbi:MAG: hypothetical protein OXG44_07360 [Gammaproteobacteria bacterium]|nr:hypothetical protein [Gammaproteobacteria bacterium]